MNKEIWKNICFFENNIKWDYTGLYQVSNYGRIRSLDRVEKYKNRYVKNKGKILKLGTHKRGYKTIMLHKDKKVKLFLVHRLVGMMFIPNPNNLPQINHKDEDKTNNCADNLEWCDNTYNSYYGTRIERSSLHQPRRKIVEYDLQGNFIKVWNSIAEAERELNLTNISSVCRGKYKQIKGHTFKYIEKLD